MINPAKAPPKANMEPMDGNTIAKDRGRIVTKMLTTIVSLRLTILSANIKLNRCVLSSRLSNGYVEKRSMKIARRITNAIGLVYPNMLRQF